MRDKRRGTRFGSGFLAGRSMEKRESSSHLRMILWLVVAYLTTLSPRNVYADGKFYPDKAYKVPPAIPSQRAILVYRKGIEKLIIESALDGQGQEFGWIIPLSSKPTEFEKVSPGLIKTLSLAIQPKITHDLTKTLENLYIIAASIGLWCLLILAKKPKKLPAMFLLLLVFIASILLMPTLHKAGRGGGGLDSGIIPGVKVHDIQKIGSYELAVLEADSSKALDKWLEINGFAGLMEKDIAIISDYIKNGWYFVAAKLRREGEGYSRPHPLAMSFATDKAIYPIRLTATVGSKVYLELFVISDKQARCKRLALELSDQYHFTEKTWRNPVGTEFFAGFTGKTYHQNIGHPNAQKHMWDGCVLSKLCGTLKPSEMDEDIVLQLKPAEPYQKRYYSQRGAREIGLAACLGVWCILPVVLTGIFYGKIKKENGRKFYLLRIIIPAVLFSLIVWPTAYGLVPKVKVETERGHFYNYYGVHLMLSIGDERAKEYIDFHEMDKKAIEARIREYFDFRISRNIFTGERIRLEDSPGNFTILEDERGIVFRVYSRNGFPFDVVVKSAREQTYNLPSKNILLLSPEEVQYHGEQILSHLELLSSKEKRCLAVQLLGRSGRKEAVKPIIDSMIECSRHSDYFHYANVAITRLTGRYPGLGAPQWWEQNKDKTRLQWLNEAVIHPSTQWNYWPAFVAAQELARLGDDTGVPILLQQLNITKDNRHIKAAVALARLGRREGINLLKIAMRDRLTLPLAIRGLLELRTEEANQLLLSQARSNPQPPAYSMIVHGLRNRCPKKVVPIVLEHLLFLSSQEPISVKETEADVNLLAQIAQVVPPLDVTDEKKMDEFIKEIETWLKLNREG